MIILAVLLCAFLPLNQGRCNISPSQRSESKPEKSETAAVPADATPCAKRSYIWPSQISESKLGKFKTAAVATDTAPCAPIGRFDVSLVFMIFITMLIIQLCSALNKIGHLLCAFAFWHLGRFTFTDLYQI